jgi:hypothetical protein
MRRLSFISMLLCLAMYSLSAGQVAFMLYGGLDLSSFRKTPDGPYTQNLRPGPYLGGALDIKIKESISCMTGLAWESRGSILTREPYGGRTVESRYVYDYLQVPILAKFESKTEKNSIWAAIGPSVGYNLNAEVVEEENPQDVEQVTTIDFGLSLWLALEIPAPTYAFVIQTGYYFGFPDADQEDDDVYRRHSTIKAGIGLKFGGKPKVKPPPPGDGY